MDGLTPYLGFVLFVFVSITTPGPNNIMTLHSGARYGIARTVSMILGIQFGFALMITMIALGSSVLLSRIENAGTVLRIICFACLLYLAWRIATAPAPKTDDFKNDESSADQGRPAGHRISRHRPEIFLGAGTPAHIAAASGPIRPGTGSGGSALLKTLRGRSRVRSRRSPTPPHRGSVLSLPPSTGRRSSRIHRPP